MRRAAALSRSTTRPPTTRRPPADYAAALGTLSFAAGETTKTVDGDPSTATPSTRSTRPTSSTSRTRRTRPSATAAGPGRSRTTTRCPRSRSTTSRSSRAIPASSMRRSRVACPRSAGERHGQLRDCERLRDQPGRLPEQRAGCQLRGRRDDEDDHGDRERRHPRRGRRHVHGEPLQRRRRPVTDAPGHRHDHGRRRAPSLSINDVTVTEGNTARSTPRSRSPERRERTHGDRRLRDCRTARRRRRRDYQARSGSLTFTPGQTTQQLDRARQRRPARRGQRDATPSTSRIRRTRPSPTTRAAARSSTTTRRRPSRSTTSRSPRATRARSTRPSPSTLSAPSGQTISVGYATADGTATAPAPITRRTAATCLQPGSDAPGR